MPTLKDAIHDIHQIAENTEWSKKLINGMTKNEWALHLVNLYNLHSYIESVNELNLSTDILRCARISNDISALKLKNLPPITKSSIDYVDYLKTIPTDLLWAHCYVLFLGEIFGGQIIKKNNQDLPSTHLDFENRLDCINYIRQKTENANHNEARRAFETTIKIYRELYELH